MRLDFSRWILMFFLITFVISFPLGIVSAMDVGAWFDDPYPTPIVEPVPEADAATAHWLIVGAFVIVLIIFGGVALRRQKS